MIEITAIMVLYFPEPVRLYDAIASVASQVSGLVIVDNTPFDEAYESYEILPSVEAITKLYPNCRINVIRLGENTGLAAGLNTGIKSAVARGDTHVLLLDQDSVCLPNMVLNLYMAMALACTEGLKVAAAGPQFSDARGEVPSSFLKVGFPTCRPVNVSLNGVYVETDVLITSGSLLRTEVLRKVGYMDESLFIDNVDIEWGFRVKAAGWRLIGVPKARLSHQLGEQHVVAPWWLQCAGKRTVLLHSPTRLYYIMRNRIALQKKAYIPFAWKAQDVIRFPWKFLLSIQTATSKCKAISAMLLGTWHGLIGQSGQKPVSNK